MSFNNKPKKRSYRRLSLNKAVLLQNNIFSHNNSLTPTDMRQHYLWGLPFLVSKIYYFEVRCSFVVIKILLCRSREMKQGCRLARLFCKSIRDFYVRNQYFLMNTQPKLSKSVNFIPFRKLILLPFRLFPQPCFCLFRREQGLLRYRG